MSKEKRGFEYIAKSFCNFELGTFIFELKVFVILR